MGLFDLFKVNIGSIKIQRQIKEAISAGDKATAKRLIRESIEKILSAGLPPRRLNLLEDILEKKEDLTVRLFQAFDRGWIRSGVQNLSNAMDEVLQEARNIIQEFGK